MLWVTAVPVTVPDASNCTLTSAVPLVPDARTESGISGGAGVDSTAAAVFDCAQPEVGVAAGRAVTCATTGVGVAALAPCVPPEPGPVRGGAEAAVRGAGVFRGGGGGGGVGGLLNAIVAGRCWMETTSLWVAGVGAAGRRPRATIKCSSSESANATSNKRGTRFMAHRVLED